MGKAKGYKDKCLGCGTEMWIPLNKKKEKVYCRECENKIRRGEALDTKINIREVTEKVDIRSEIEALRRIEVTNPRLLEELCEPLNNKKKK